MRERRVVNKILRKAFKCEDFMENALVAKTEGVEGQRSLKVLDERRAKLDLKSVMTIHFGYNEHSKGYRLYDMDSKKLFICRDVKFDESDNLLHIDENESTDIENEDLAIKGSRTLHDIYNRCNVVVSDPVSYTDANVVANWKAAMYAEINMILNNGTLTLVEKPSNQHVIGVKWIYKTKYPHSPFREVALEYLKTSLETVKKLLNVLMRNLGVELDDSKIGSLIGRKTVNMNYYPTCPNPELTVGVGRHSDMGTLTVLLQDGVGGLYVNVPGDADIGKKGEWVEIPPIPGALVINVGDMLQILSNGRYKSAEHRVRTTSSKSRVSIPIFTIPKPTEKIAPLPQVVEKDGIAHYREFLLADYMNNFFGNPHDGKKSLDFARI
ncbi:1-aminocyclopropane-1-carboxylate oxidase-like [Herrania umbratica]|uniref:1-aminocyclopropane-1-carboxylate oxidase-like n=1 Tax=Herrania umbratica TaxID=108875 RepID=A0A6J1AMH4_9ROSI|nr:1-aminocyclopropane-1-carboxylate oxidase-like [Herrania umbratica]